MTRPASDPVFAALGDPVRRRLLELVHRAGEQPAGALVDALRSERDISQPAVSQHLRVLREARLVQARAEGTRRLYAVDPVGIDAARSWLVTFADPFSQPLDALDTELARGRRDRRRAAAASDSGGTSSDTAGTAPVSGSPSTGSLPGGAAGRGARRAG
ncbi:ArsR/SmtB family transcription factor [Isoptericola halotolerans]|uniref:DNA-binding transcriptional ArsR family regulator n=2 Tax=Isoptericola halotolerans TaxID=300560 RepID=A0ABX2A8L9_9MICO|nr:metalloregulator ArsR/SmtB family transcription factor [Isoptericola halotolerans]NOV98285.1 DNA-binding transcriptional ArsR family regulator [Isoptericola halotolerans]